MSAAMMVEGGCSIARVVRQMPFEHGGALPAIDQGDGPPVYKRGLH